MNAMFCRYYIPALYWEPLLQNHFEQRKAHYQREQETVSMRLVVRGKAYDEIENYHVKLWC